MGILIAGHPRSGTSMFRIVLDSHPDIKMTSEFGCYQYLNLPLRDHWRLIFKRFLDRRNNSFRGFGKSNKKKVKGAQFVKNLPFVMHYLSDLSRQGANPVTAVAATKAVHKRVCDNHWCRYCFGMLSMGKWKL